MINRLLELTKRYLFYPNVCNEAICKNCDRYVVYERVGGSSVEGLNIENMIHSSTVKK